MNDGYIWKGEETIRCTRLEETVDCPEEWRGEEEVRSQQSVKNKKYKKEAEIISQKSSLEEEVSLS